jgi:2-alkenal reductase
MAFRDPFNDPVDPDGKNDGFDWADEGRDEERSGGLWSSLFKIGLGVLVVAALVIALVLPGGFSDLQLFAPPAAPGDNFRPASFSLPLASTPEATATAAPATLLQQAEALQQVMINVYQRVDPSVVNIEVTRVTGRQVANAGGSGFVFDAQGHIVTNAHVVQDAREILVTFRDGYTTNATLVGTDEYSDLAVVRVSVNAARLVPVTLGDSSTLQVGQSVIAIGNPYGLRSSMTTGIISATGRTLSSARMLSGLSASTLFQNPSIIQVDASINPGNSGGPLLDIYGEVIGVNTAIRTESGGFQGIAFAVPVNTVRRIVPQLIARGRAEYSWLGIQSISAESTGVNSISMASLAERFNLPVNYGALITGVLPNSPAAAAGLQGGTRAVNVRGIEVRLGGDIIVAVNGVPMRDFDALIGYLVANTSPGDTVTLTIYRGTQVFDVDVRLEARPS